MNTKETCTQNIAAFNEDDMFNTLEALSRTVGQLTQAAPDNQEIKTITHILNALIEEGHRQYGMIYGY